MPNALVKSFADKTGKSVSDVEKAWEEVVAGLKDSGKSEEDKNFYAIVVSVLKKKLHINEAFTSFKDFRNLKSIES